MRLICVVARVCSWRTAGESAKYFVEEGLAIILLFLIPGLYLLGNPWINVLVMLIMTERCFLFIKFAR